MANNYYRKLSHCVYDCRYHLVFTPKYRYQILADEEVQSFVKTVIEQECESRDIQIIEGKLRPDHVHLYVSIPPKYAISDVAKWIKGKSATRAFEKFPNLLRRYWGRHLWARGYFVSTVGITDEIIKAYIQSQEKKEQEEQDKLRQLQLWK